MSQRDFLFYGDATRFYLDGGLVRTILRRKSLKQKQVAHALRFSAPTFYRIIEGKRSVDKSTVAALSTFLKVKPESIILQVIESSVVSV